MAKKPQETLLPDRKGRGDFYSKIKPLPVAEQLDAVQKRDEEWQAHPDFAAKQRIEEYLTMAHLHPDLRASPELSKLVFLFRELLADAEPGETVAQILEPLQTLMARHGGGRPPETDHEAVKRYHARLASNGDHDATSQTAAAFNITTRAVRKILES